MYSLFKYNSVPVLRLPAVHSTAEGEKCGDMPHHSTIEPRPSANSTGALGVYRRFPAPLRALTIQQPISASRPLANYQPARCVPSPGSIKTTHPTLTVHSLSRLTVERTRETLLATTRDKHFRLGKRSRLTSTSSRASSRSPSLPIKPSFVLPSFLDPLRNFRTHHTVSRSLRSYSRLAVHTKGGKLPDQRRTPANVAASRSSLSSLSASPATQQQQLHLSSP